MAFLSSPRSSLPPGSIATATTASSPPTPLVTERTHQDNALAAQILAHIGEPTSPPRLHSARGPPQAELTFELGAPYGDEIVQEFPPDDLDQTPDHDPTEPDPIPDDEFDQAYGD